ELSVLYGRAETYAVFRQHMDAIGATPDRLTAQRGYAHTNGRKWVGGPVGLLWHAAEHSADAVARDLEAWLPHLSEGAVVVLHDAGNPEYGVVEGALRVLGDGWQFEDEDGHLHGEPQVIRWRKNPQRRGMLVARRCRVEETSPQEEAVEEPSGVVGDVEQGGRPRGGGGGLCPVGSVSVAASGWWSSSLRAANRSAPWACMTRVRPLRHSGAPCMRQNGGWRAGDSLLYELYVLG